MRTTVEMKPEHRSALLSVTLSPGTEGILGCPGRSHRHYLRAEQDREKRRKSLLSLAPALSRHEAVNLRRTVQHLREHWR